MGLRALVLRLMPRSLRAAAEAESRQWIATCPSCARQTSVWDLGGLRYKAAGRPSRGLRCAGCGKFGLHRLHRRA